MKNFERNEPVYVRDADDEPWRLRFFDRIDQEEYAYSVYPNGYNSKNVPPSYGSKIIYDDKNIIRADPTIPANVCCRILNAMTDHLLSELSGVEIEEGSIVYVRDSIHDDWRERTFAEYRDGVVDTVYRDGVAYTYPEGYDRSTMTVSQKLVNYMYCIDARKADRVAVETLLAAFEEARLMAHSDLKVDDPIFVRNSSEAEWVRQHYSGSAKHTPGEDGADLIFTFVDGRTSWSNSKGRSAWKQVKIPTQAQLKEQQEQFACGAYIGYNLDDPIIVTNVLDAKDGFKQHFAGVTSQNHLVSFAKGKSSWTAEVGEEKQSWTFCLTEKESAGKGSTITGTNVTLEPYAESLGISVEELDAAIKSGFDLKVIYTGKADNAICNCMLTAKKSNVTKSILTLIRQLRK